MAALPHPRTPSPAVVHLGEFVDTLAALRRGHVIVVMDADKRTWLAEVDAWLARPPTPPDAHRARP